MTWVLIALLVVGFGWVWYRGMRPWPNRIESPDRVAHALQFLLTNGVHRGSVRFQVDTDPSRAVTFTKYIQRHGVVGLNGYCARGGEPEGRFDALKRDMTERGIPHSLTTGDGEGIIEVNCGRDIGHGVMLVVLAFQHLFEVTLREHCVALYANVVITNKPSLTGVDDAPNAPW